MDEDFWDRVEESGEMLRAEIAAMEKSHCLDVKTLPAEMRLFVTCMDGGVVKFTIVEGATKVLVVDGTNFKDPTEGKLMGTIVSGPPEERDDGVIRIRGKKELLPGAVKQGGLLKYEVGGQEFTAPIQAVKITLRSGKEYDLWVD
jgi:hypothetical protein